MTEQEKENIARFLRKFWRLILFIIVAFGIFVYTQFFGGSGEKAVKDTGKGKEIVAQKQSNANNIVHAEQKVIPDGAPLTEEDFTVSGIREAFDKKSIGYTFENIEKVFGELELVRNISDSKLYKVWYKPINYNIEIFFMGDKSYYVGERLKEIKMFSWVSKDNRLKTIRNVGVGNTVDDLKKVYGKYFVKKNENEYYIKYIPEKGIVGTENILVFKVNNLIVEECLYESDF